MTLLRRPLGVWILAAWCAAQAGVAAVFGLDAGRLTGLAAWSFCAMQVIFLVGLLLPWRLTRPLLLVYVAASILGVAVVLWFFVFVGVAWGVRGHDFSILAPIAAYLLFLAWSLFYLFHPDVSDYLSGLILPPLSEPVAREAQAPRNGRPANAPSPATPQQIHAPSANS
jgi:hypothetical protein